MQGIVLLKLLIDAIACAGFVYDSNTGMGLMFGGMAIADAGALWMTPGG